MFYDKKITQNRFKGTYLQLCIACPKYFLKFRTGRGHCCSFNKGRITKNSDRNPDPWPDLCFQANFIGKEALMASRSEWRNQRVTMLEVDVDNVDPEGNESIWSCGRVKPFCPNNCCSNNFSSNKFCSNKFCCKIFCSNNFCSNGRVAVLILCCM
jgi:hypothetical protein